MRNALNTIAMQELKRLMSRNRGNLLFDPSRFFPLTYLRNAVPISHLFTRLMRNLFDAAALDGSVNHGISNILGFPKDDTSFTGTAG